MVSVSAGVEVSVLYGSVDMGEISALFMPVTAPPEENE